jgi:hypothetical protein
MKMLTSIVVLFSASGLMAKVSLRAGMSGLACSNGIYSVTAYTDKYGTEGTAIVTRRGKIVNITALVKSGIKDNKVAAQGLEFELSVEAEANNRGALEFEEGSRSRKIKFDELQCAPVPNSWPDPGQI